MRFVCELKFAQIKKTSVACKHANLKFLLKPKRRVKFTQTQKVKFNRLINLKPRAEVVSNLHTKRGYENRSALNFTHHIVDYRLRAVSIHELKQSFARARHVEALNQAQNPLAARVLLT